MDWSIWTSYYYDLTIDKALKEISNLSIKFVELSSEHISEIFAVLGKIRYIDGYREEEAINKAKNKAKIAEYRSVYDIKELMDSLEISMIHAHGPFEFSTEFILQQGNWRKYVTEKLAEWFKIYNVLEVPIVVIHPLTDNEKCGCNIEKLNLEYFKVLESLASEYQIDIAIENMIRGIGSSISNIKKIIKNIGKERLGICIDTGHANINAYRGMVYKTFLEADGYLMATHIHDNDGSSDQHLLPSKGNIDWKKVFEAISEIDYKKPLNLEIPGERLESLDKRREKLVYFIRNYKSILHI